MKKFEKLTEQEICKLTDEQLQKYYELRMAEKGIPFMDKPKQPEYEKIENPNLILYSWTLLNIYFTDEKVVSDILTIIKNNKDKARKIDSDYSAPTKFEYEVKSLKNNSWDSNEITFNTTQKHVYSTDKVEQLKDISNRNKKRADEYEKLEAKYLEYEEQRNECKAEIYDKYYEVVEKFNDLKTHKNRFIKYIDLADGNKEMALKFYKDAYDITEEVELELNK